MNFPHRALILYTGAGFGFLWLDISLGHVGGGLKHAAMWLPLIFLPVATVTSVLAVLRSTKFRLRLFHGCCYGAVVLGAVGFGFHLTRFLGDLKGVVQWGALIRFMRYPPLFAPLAVSGLGMFGLLAQPADLQGSETRGGVDTSK